MNVTADDVIHLLGLLERYQFLVDVLLGHYEGAEQKFCSKCEARRKINQQSYKNKKARIINKERCAA